MGYRNDIRVLLPKKNFNALDKKLRKMEFFPEYDIKSFRNEDADAVKLYSPKRKPIQFVYFGWDYIKWGNDELVEAVEDAVFESEYYHFIRIGEEYSDIEESYGLEDAFINCISVVRYFDDNYLEEESRG